MCFYNKNNKILRAKEDIVCHKFMFNEDGKIFSIIERFPYVLGKPNKEIKLKYNKDENVYRIKQGYHSYIPRQEDFGWGWDELYECIIPKGSKYAVNEREYVSSNIIIVKKIKDNLRARSGVRDFQSVKSPIVQFFR